ncbi:MAG: RNA 2',3'-cyclic phosphodiesterase [Bacteroidales bacterium]|nr:RNA 2',3'-cyclic phosphodiesterase [Bacteroidales bacterium]
MKRTFIAIKISNTKSISEVYQNIRLELKDERVKWVEEQNLHITLAFLGDTDEKDIDNVCNMLSEYTEGLNPFLIKITGLGVFRNVNNPKALWLGIKKSEDLNQIYNKINVAISLFGFTIQSKDFRPHLTIGRTKFLKNRSKLKNLIEKYKETQIEQLKISEVYFYESILTSEGPVYKVIKKYNLN